MKLTVELIATNCDCSFYRLLVSVGFGSSFVIDRFSIHTSLSGPFLFSLTR